MLKVKGIFLVCVDSILIESIRAFWHRSLHMKTWHGSRIVMNSVTFSHPIRLDQNFSITFWWKMCFVEKVMYIYIWKFNIVQNLFQFFLYNCFGLEYLDTPNKKGS